MQKRSIAVCFALLLPCAAWAQGPLASPDAARAWYIAMIVDHECIMTQYQVRDALEAAFPYNNLALRESGFMAADAGMALVSDGLITMASGGLGIIYSGPEC